MVSTDIGWTQFRLHPIKYFKDTKKKHLRVKFVRGGYILDCYLIDEVALNNVLGAKRRRCDICGYRNWVKAVLSEKFGLAYLCKTCRIKYNLYDKRRVRKNTVCEN